MRHLLRRAALAAVVLALPLVATPVSAAPFPHVISIPSDFEPEGIAVGAGSTFYVGSLRSGDIYRGDLRTGTGGLLVDTLGRVAATHSPKSSSLATCRTARWCRR